MDKRDYCEGSFTVEAVYVMIIIIWIVIALLYSTLYAHDIVVAKSVLQLSLMKGEETKQTTQMINGQTFLMNGYSIKKSEELLCEKATLSYDIEIKDKLIQMILFHGREEGSTSVEKEKATCVELMWDSVVIEEKAGDLYD